MSESDRPKHDPKKPTVDSGEGFTTHRRQDLESLARSVSAGGATTLFQPGAMIDSILQQGNNDTGSSTWVVHNPPQAADHRLPDTPFFMVCGAPPGFERIPITGTGMIFGRDEGHVRLDDPSISSRHFQVDIVGREFFVRDLDSSNGTLLNGHGIRYSEILPGDELKVGNSTLIFRVAGDGISRSDS